MNYFDRNSNLTNRRVAVCHLYLSLLFICFVIIFSSCKETTVPKVLKQETRKYYAPISIEGLRNRTYKADFNFEKNVHGAELYNSSLYSFYSDSLKIYTLVNTPKIEIPVKGFPVLIFGHGFHPEPKRYGVSNETGQYWRPGDYYRGIPEAYAENGFLVLTPDYRGHNISDGFEFTKTSYLASSYYAIDILHLIDALKSLENVNLNNIYFMGHSMGGDVGLKMLLATNKIKAASIWAGVSSTIWEQAIHYAKWSGENEDVINTKSMSRYTSSVDSVVNKLGYVYDIDSGDPINFIQDLSTPLIIHHATNDTSVPYQWSESLAAKLFANNNEFEFYSYDSENHLLKNMNLDKAIVRDIVFFNKY